MIRSLIAVALLMNLTASSQGSWNIGYIPIDSITENVITKTVKIDFKSNIVRRFKNKYLTIRHYIESQDTGQIDLEGKMIELIERRRIYVDAGNYSEQYLECPSIDSSHVLRIYDSEIMEIKNDSILFRLHGELYRKKKGKAIGEPDITTALCWIEKNKLDGLMIRQ